MSEASGVTAAGRPARSPRAGADAGSTDLETRTRLLDAAQELFATRGFDATRTKQVADRAGVSNGLLFYYFPTKQELLEALVRERSFVPELHQFLQSACDVERDDPRTTLIEIERRLLRFLHEHRDLVRIMVQAPLAGEDSRMQPLRQTLQAGIDELAAYLDGLMGAGRLGRTDPRVFARVFMSSFAFTVIAPLTHDADDYVAATVDLLLHQAPARAADG